MTQEIDPVSIEDGSYYESTKSLPSYQTIDSNQATNRAIANDNKSMKMELAKSFFVIVSIIIISVLLTFNPLFFFLWFSVVGSVIVLDICDDIKNNKGLFCVGLGFILGGACALLVFFVLAHVYDDGQHWWHMCTELRYGWWNNNYQG